jgi:hypothetical protein
MYDNINNSQNLLSSENRDTLYAKAILLSVRYATCT